MFWLSGRLCLWNDICSERKAFKLCWKFAMSAHMYKSLSFLIVPILLGEGAWKEMWLLLDDKKYPHVAGILLIACRIWLNFSVSLCSYTQIVLLAETEGAWASMARGWLGCPPSHASGVPGTVHSPASMGLNGVTLPLAPSKRFVSLVIEGRSSNTWTQNPQMSSWFRKKRQCRSTCCFPSSSFKGQFYPHCP